MIDMVRVRMAPSPTGYLHIGNARTALYNYLFAKKNNGVLVLRVEDTDKERSKKEYEDDILEGLHWLGVHWNEGPDVGGEYGPYRQSERLELYKKYLKILDEKGYLYRCYCTEEELEKNREIQMLSKQPPRYSGACSALSEEECAVREKEGKASTLRFRIPHEQIRVSDLIRGDIDFDMSLLDDFIIAKDFDTPLYNFAVVVDDYLMKITHVIRGEDHISNTPKQIALCRALGFDIPQFAHLPLILNAVKTKLSKRQNKVSLLEYKKDGYLPEAVLNFFVLLGWGSGDDRELFTLKDLESLFDLSGVHRSGAVFNMQKLDWFNAHYIRQKPINELVDLCIPYFLSVNVLAKTESANVFRSFGTGSEISKDTLTQILTLEKERIKRLSDCTVGTEYFFVDQPFYNKDILRWKQMSDEDVKTALFFVDEILQKIDENHFTAIQLESALKAAIVESGKQNGEILWPLRVALTGLKASPSPFDVAPILGKQKTIQRIIKARSLFS